MTADAFLAAYLDCALWSSTDHDGEPFDAWATVDDIAPESLAELRADCVEFYADHAAEWAELWSDEQAGHDFWLTRNHHGAGYWDRYYGDQRGAVVGRMLTDAAHVYGSVDLYEGDDGKVYAS